MATASSFTLDPAMLFENGKTASLVTVGSVSYYRVGNGARWKWTTSARKMTVSFYCEYSSGLGNNGRCAILINGVPRFFGAYQGAAGNVWVVPMRLDPGANKTIELFVPMQYASSAGGTPVGTYPYFVQFDDLATEISPTAPSNHLIIYGDSVDSGGVAISPAVYGYAGLMKAGAYSGNVTLICHGARRLADDCSTSGAATAFVADMLARLPDKILIKIGSNDQALIPNVSLANFTIYAARLLDEIHAQDPTKPVTWLSPIRRGAEAANSSGETLAQFRTAISTLVTARSAWSVPPVYSDGLAIFSDLSQLPDGVHPGTAGNVTMETAVLALV